MRRNNSNGRFPPGRYPPGGGPPPGGPPGGMGRGPFPGRGGPGCMLPIIGAILMIALLIHFI